MSRVGLLRLQDMYKFSVKDMVTGNITGGSKLEATLDGIEKFSLTLQKGTSDLNML